LTAAETTLSYPIPVEGEGKVKKQVISKTGNFPFTQTFTCPFLLIRRKDRKEVRFNLTPMPL
jgi:hypothetical protein